MRLALKWPIPPLTRQQSEPPLADFLDAVRDALHLLLALPAQASSMAARIDDLQYFQFVGFWSIGLILLGAAVWFLVRYRRRAPDGTMVRTREIKAPLWLDIGVAGSLLGIFVLWWVIGFRQYTEIMTAPPPDAIDVYVTGRQWVWKFDYAEGPSSAGVLYVPLRQPVRLILTSRDVIHSFFVPAFRLKQDAVPGRFTTTWFEATRPGRYQLMCAELCGVGHSRMWGEVVVVEPDQFEQWLGGTPIDHVEPADEAQALSPARGGARADESLAERGLRVAAEHGCLNCHTTDGTRHLAPTWRGLYGAREPLSNGDTATATPDYLTESMMDPQAKIVSGFQPIMPTFKGQLEPAEVAALIEYMKSIRRPVGANETSRLDTIPGTGATGNAPDTQAVRAGTGERRPGEDRR